MRTKNIFLLFMIASSLNAMTQKPLPSIDPRTSREKTIDRVKALLRHIQGIKPETKNHRLVYDFSGR